MALANVTYTANGATTVFVVPFGYLQESHITVKVDGVVSAGYSFNGDGDIEFSVAPLSGEEVYIERDSDISQTLVAYGDGSNLTQEDLNNDANQSIYLQQETRDQIDTINADNSAVVSRVDDNEADIATNVLAIDTKIDGLVSSVDNTLPRFDGITGTVLQSSGVVIDDVDGITTTGNVIIGSGTAKELNLTDDIILNKSTGVTAPVTLSVNSGDATKFDVSVVTGHIVDIENSLYYSISYAGGTAITPTNMSGGNYILIDNTGALVQQTTVPTSEERRLNLFLGRVGVSASSGNVSVTIAEPVVAEQSNNNLWDLMTSLGLFNVAGNQISANGSNLNIDKAEGSLFSAGANYVTDRNDPNIITSAAMTALTFIQYLQTGTSIGSTTLIDPANYDLGGVVTTVAGVSKRATNQRVYLSPTGTVIVSYGQTIYNTIAKAVSGIATESFITNPVLNGTVLIAIISIRKDCTDLSNTSKAKISFPSKFGETVSGSGSEGINNLQDAYNGADEGEIIIDTTLGAVKIRDAATPSAGDIFTVESEDSSTVFLNVDADGVSTSKDISMTGTGQIKVPSGTSAERSGTPSNGMFRYNSDLGQYEGYKNSTWSPIAGGGGGGLDIINTETFEDIINAASFTSGNDVTYDNAGTVDGTLSDDTSTNISGDTSLKYVMSTSSTNDWVKSPVIALDSKQQSQTLGMTFYYTYNGDNDDIKVVVYDDTNSEVLTSSVDFIKASSTPQRFSVEFPTNTDTDNISYGFQVVTGNSGKILVVDDVEISTNPFVYKDSIIDDCITLSDNSGEAITANTENIVFEGSATGWDDSTYEYEVQRNNSILSLSVGVGITSSLAPRLELYKNGVALKSFSLGISTSRHVGDLILSKGEVVAGDKLSIRSTIGFTLLSSTKDHYLTIRETTELEQIISYNSRNAENSMVRLHTGNGHGSTNTKIRRFTTEVSNIGNAITYTDSSSLGGSFTIEEDGVYYVSYSDSFTGTGTGLGLSVNSSQLTTSVFSITEGDRLSHNYLATTNTPESTSWSGKLQKGDIVRAHTSGAANSSVPAYTAFTITKIGVGDLLGVPLPRTAYIKDIKASSTDGGTFTSGAWQTRDLNTLSGDTEFISLSSNQFTLQPGKYEIEASAPANEVDGHKSKLYNISDSTDAIIGRNIEARASGNCASDSLLRDTITITSVKTFELQHRCDVTKTTNGLGKSVSYGVDEIYAEVKITKVS